MTTDTTLANKLAALNQNETQLLAAIQSNRAQAKTLDEQYKQLEEQRHVYAGAKLIIAELQKESAPDATPSPACECDAVIPLPAQS